MKSLTKRIPLAIIGCGAVTERLHLPAAQQIDRVRVTVLVDLNVQRAQRLAEQYNVEYAVDDYRAIHGRVDAAIVALPHYLHAPVSIDLLRQGMHVLVEKPMALNAAECNDMIKAAEDASRTLAVGLVRRFSPANLYVKQILDAGLLGRIERFDVREGGSIFGWPAASDFFFRKGSAGGGVLEDTGAHTLDLLLWWLGDYASLEYEDDAFGGVEANCMLRLRLKSGVEGVVELSRMRDLRNTFQIHGERGMLEIGCGFPCPIRMHSVSGELVLEGSVRRLTESSPESLLDMMRRQLEDFVEAIFGGHPPFVPGEEARRSISLIEACYQQRRDLDLLWLRSRGEVR